MVQNFQSQNSEIHPYYCHHYTIVKVNSQAKNFSREFYTKNKFEMIYNFTSKVSKWMMMMLSIVDAVMIQLQSIVGKSGDFKI